MATIEAHELPTEEEVYAHMRAILPKLRPCKGGDHNWDMTEAQGYTASGRRFRGSDLRDAAWFECTDTCLPDDHGTRGCGRQRSYQMEWSPRIQDLVRTTDYSYSNMHPDLASPKGVSLTGINPRSEMPDIIRSEKIRRNLLKVAAPHPSSSKGAA